MAEPARKPSPTRIVQSGPAPQLRTRALRAAGDGDVARPSEAKRLQAKVADAFTTPAQGRLEGLLMKLVILAASCLVLRTVVMGGAGAFGLLR